jgi:hypothetical protein
MFQHVESNQKTCEKNVQNLPWLKVGTGSVLERVILEDLG